MKTNHSLKPLENPDLIITR